MFKFSPESIGNMYMKDLAFWNQGVEQIAEWKSGK